MRRPVRVIALGGLVAALLVPLSTRGQNVRVEAGPVAEKASEGDASSTGRPGEDRGAPEATRIRGIFGPEEGESLSFVDGYA
ncbi:MAG TPA: hypothetical protein VLA66_11070, partial [Thermoanaerobaculia bacterium]|nr:hypothetical protein [Thermoanaerobaculia bacterium]